MIIFPAIDIKNGQCVRLQQGAKEDMTVYGDDPVAMAQQLEREGAQALHVVDLDGAFDGDQRHRNVIERLLQSVSIPVQIGGGIRTKEAVDAYVTAGAERVIIGSKAVSDPDFISELTKQYGEAIAVSVDAKNGKVATKGWVEVSEWDALDFIRDMKNRGVETFIYTDISRDGMLGGPNVEAIVEAQKIGDIQVIASGGVSSPADLKELASHGIYGAITGKALYEGKVTMADIRALRGGR